jgi:hypothetical protein
MASPLRWIDALLPAWALLAMSCTGATQQRPRDAGARFPEDAALPAEGGGGGDDERADGSWLFDAPMPSDGGSREAPPVFDVAPADGASPDCAEEPSADGPDAPTAASPPDRGPDEPSAVDSAEGGSPPDGELQVQGPDGPAARLDAGGEAGGARAADAAAVMDTARAYDAPAGWDGSPPEAGQERIWVYLMAGQSNMVGLGMNGQLPQDSRGLVPGASIYYNDSRHPDTHTLEWLPLGPGFGLGDDQFGPELSFGRHLRELFPRRRVAIIKVAEGATTLVERWKARTGDLYQLLVSETRSQLQVLAGQGRPQIAGLVWMQGESDGTDQYAASVYGKNLTDFVLALRADLDSAFMPMVAGLIAMDAGWRYGAAVRDATSQVAARLGRMETIETDDLSMFSDDLPHYDSDGNLELGRRFAEAVAGMQRTVHWRFPADFSSRQGEACWTYRARGPSGSATELVFASASAQWLGSDSPLAIGKGWMQTGTASAAELAFWAPFAGRLDVSLNAGMADPGETGASLVVGDAQGTTLRSFSVQYPTRVWDTVAVTVEQGDELRFRTSAVSGQPPPAGPAGWDIDLTMTEVDE